MRLQIETAPGEWQAAGTVPLKKYADARRWRLGNTTGTVARNPRGRGVEYSATVNGFASGRGFGSTALRSIAAVRAWAVSVY